jgi:hypothetical protein
MSTTCLHCGAETSNGLALCNLCQEGAKGYLTDVPIFFRNLARRVRPGRPNGSLSSGGRGGGDSDEADNHTLIQRALSHAVNDLTTWTRALTDDRGVESPDAATEAEMVATLCAFLAEHMSSIATLGWAGQFVHDIARHEKALRQLSVDAVLGWYAGACRQPTGRDMDGVEHTCGADIHVVPGLTWVTCQSCGTTTHAADHLPVILEEATDWIGTTRSIAEAVVALVDTEESPRALRERIKKWDQRGRITALERPTRINGLGDEIPVGPKRFRLGDVLELTLTTETRQSGSDAAAS